MVENLCHGEGTKPDHAYSFNKINVSRFYMGHDLATGKKLNKSTLLPGGGVYYSAGTSDQSSQCELSYNARALSNLITEVSFNIIHLSILYPPP